MEGHLDIIKQLVDSLTVSLTNILLKIESINPVLTRLSEEMQDGKAVSQETIDAVKELKNEIMSYHESMMKMPRNFERIENIESDISDIKSKIKPEDITEMKSQLEEFKKLLVPVSKLSKFIMKPIAAVLFVLTSCGALVAIIESIKFFFNK